MYYNLTFVLRSFKDQFVILVLQGVALFICCNFALLICCKILQFCNFALLNFCNVLHFGFGHQLETFINQRILIRFRWFSRRWKGLTLSFSTPKKSSKNNQYSSSYDVFQSTQLQNFANFCKTPVLRLVLQNTNMFVFCNTNIIL